MELARTNADGWVVEVLRARPAAPPWPRMVRAPLAICVPLGVGLALGHAEPGLLAAIGGLISSVLERGGPYLGRLRRVGTATVLGSCVGLLIGLAIHGRGWLIVAVIVPVALLSSVISASGNVGSVTGLQLLVYTVLGTGPLGVIHPWWTVVLLFLAGAGWGMTLSVLGWLVFPHAPQDRGVAAAYRATAAVLRAVGTDAFEPRRRELTEALNTAYDQVLSTRAARSGPESHQARLVGLLNQTHGLAEGVLAVAGESTRAPVGIADALDELAANLDRGRLVPVPVPEPESSTPGVRALTGALTAANRICAGELEVGRSLAQRRGGWRRRVREFLETLRHARLVRLSAVRLMLCMAVAAVLSEVVAVQRSYWVMLTVAIVLKPDFGSVFARALQRGIGTLVGVGLGAVVLALVPRGPLLIVPLAVLALLLPYGMIRNYGLFATFLTPLVVVLIDMLVPAGWQLAQYRLLDTLLGCGVVLVLGYAPWPGSWHASVRPELAGALSAVAEYLREVTERPTEDSTAEPMAGPPRASLARRRAYRRLADLRTTFQRALAEPKRVSAPTAAAYPVLVELERVLDATTSSAVTARHAAAPLPRPATDQLVAALRESSRAVGAGEAPRALPLPDDEAARPLAEPVRAIQQLLDRRPA